MPGHITHCYVDRELFHKSYWRLHRNIDMPYLFMGKKHRVLFHDGLSSVAIARKLYPGDQLAEEAAIVHCQLDELCSSYPLFKKQLDFLANLDAKERRKAHAQKKAKRLKTMYGDPLKDFTEFLKKVEEIQWLYRMLSR